MGCPETKCLCPGACNILGECVMMHQLIKGHQDNFRAMILAVNETKRPRQIIRIFEALQPSRVNHFQVNRYWGYKVYQGIDMDKPGCPKYILKLQRSYKRKESREARSVILKRLKSAPVMIETDTEKIKEFNKELKIIIPKSIFDIDKYNAESSGNFHEEE
jgi:hypothetical protein